MTPPTSDLQTLFNRKARSWQQKYQPGGKLNCRLEQFVRRLSELCPPSGNILDLGCGTGDISAAIVRMGYQVTACDIAENMLEKARSNWIERPVKWVSLKADWDILPFNKGCFDAIVASSVFEYLVDIEGVARELSRVLRPGGLLISSVPNPCNRTRKVEAWLCSNCLSLTLKWLSCKIPRLQSYLTYLRLSRNRFNGEGWESILTAAGFVPFDKEDFSRDKWFDKAKAPLIILAVKKEVAGHPPVFKTDSFL